MASETPAGEPTPPAHRRSFSRRTFLGALPVAGLAAASFAFYARGAAPHIALYAQGVELGAEGLRFVPVDEASLAALGMARARRGTRVAADAGLLDAARWIAGEQRLLAAAQERLGADAHGFAGLARDALLDLHALGADRPVSLAGWNYRWRYVWPRDAAHVLFVLANLGQVDDVARGLAFLASVQRADGWFEPRTALDGSVPDDRAMQSDGLGWFLWATGSAVLALPEHRARIVAATGPAVDLALRTLLHHLGLRGGMPSASSDYWEMTELHLSLGTAAPLLAGLQTAARAGIVPDGLTDRVDASAARLAEGIRELFGANGYRRYSSLRGFTRAGYDASVCFLAPPYVTGFESEIAAVLPTAWEAMQRPAGGVSPGVGWKDAHIAWTPATALFAQAWAHLGTEFGDAARAREILAWLDEHRTPLGAIPEKVLDDGSPAAVAPLGWSCALVVSALLALPQA